MLNVIILTYPYSRKSAGIVSQHKLCHLLRLNGINAFILVIKGKPSVHPHWVTPIWRGSVFDHTSIAIYGEEFDRNYLGATFSIQWILGNSMKSQLRGDFDRTFRWHGDESEKLALDILNKDVFYSDEAKKTNNFLVYRGKNRVKLRDIPYSLNIKCVERFGTRALTQYQLAQTFRESKGLFVAEDSLVLEEAIACGCPVVIQYGVDVPTYVAEIPGVYQQENPLDWPNLDELETSVREGAEIVKIMNVSREFTVDNLITEISRIESLQQFTKSPKVNLPKIALLHIKQKRVYSAWENFGVKGILNLVYDSLRSKISI